MADTDQDGLFSARVSRETPAGRQYGPLLRGGGKSVEVEVTGGGDGEEHTFVIPAAILWDLLKATDGKDETTMADMDQDGLFSARVSRETPAGRQYGPLLWGRGKSVEVEVTGGDDGEEHTIPAAILWDLLKATTKQGNVWAESYSEDKRITEHLIEDPHSIYILSTSILRHPPGEGRQHREGSTPE